MAKASAQIVSKTVTSADGTPIFAEAAGDPSKPAIVFVNGFALSGTVFDIIFQNSKLLEKLYLVRYDPRGHGRSGQPEEEAAYESARYAEDYKAVAKAFDLHKPIWAGWSVAGAISTDIIAELGPDAVSGIVYIAAVPCLGPLSDPMRSDLLNTCIMGMLSPDAATNAQSTISFVDACFKDVSKVPYVLRTSMIGTALTMSITSRLRLLMRQQDSTKLFAAGAEGLPVLVIYGAEDAIVNAGAIVDACKGRFKRLLVKPVEGAGHTPFVEQPEAFVAGILEFAQQVL